MAYQGNHPLSSELVKDRDIKRVLLRHKQIERKLHQEMLSPTADWDGIRLLKAQRLQLVDELARLKQEKGVH